MADMVAFTDGACRDNGTSYARAGYAVLWVDDERLDYSASLKGSPQTRNRAEYMAAIRAMEIADNVDSSGGRRLIIYSDSKLLRDTVHEWILDWARNGWRRSNGEPVMNLDLVKELHYHIGRRKIEICHVRAHSNSDDWASRMNARVDRMAWNACR